MRTYRRHNCGRAHRSAATMARCIWRHAHWVTGYHHGTYASVSYCRGTTVMLWATAAQAEQAVQDMYSACGGACRNDHHAIRIELPVTNRGAATHGSPTRRAA